MGAKSKIAWTDATWNPTTGCAKVSPGCQNCYAEKTASWLKGMGVKRYAKGFAPTFHKGALGEPLKWRKPKDVFVCSTSDLFLFGDERIEKVFGIIDRTPHHTYFVLTKRHDRMLGFLKNRGKVPPNMIVGVSVEDFENFYQRGYALVEIKKHFPDTRTMVSFEPLLENVAQIGSETDDSPGTLRIRSIWKAIDWAVVGGESGPNARPFEPSWIAHFLNKRDIYRFRLFVKQMGAVLAKKREWSNKKGEDMSEWPGWLRVRQQYPEAKQ